MTSDLYTPAEVAKLMRVHHETVLRWIKAGKVKATRPMRKLFIPASEVERLKRGEAA